MSRILARRNEPPSEVEVSANFFQGNAAAWASVQSDHLEGNVVISGNTSLLGLRVTLLFARLRRLALGLL